MCQVPLPSLRRDEFLFVEDGCSTPNKDRSLFSSQRQPIEHSSSGESLTKLLVHIYIYIYALAFLPNHTTTLYPRAHKSPPTIVCWDRFRLSLRLFTSAVDTKGWFRKEAVYIEVRPWRLYEQIICCRSARVPSAARAHLGDKQARHGVKFARQGLLGMYATNRGHQSLQHASRSANKM